MKLLLESNPLLNITSNTILSFSIVCVKCPNTEMRVTFGCFFKPLVTFVFIYSGYRTLCLLILNTLIVSVTFYSHFLSILNKYSIYFSMFFIWILIFFKDCTFTDFIQHIIELIYIFIIINSIYNY